jgi:hypothetical protein
VVDRGRLGHAQDLQARFAQLLEANLATFCQLGELDQPRRLVSGRRDNRINVDRHGDRGRRGGIQMSREHGHAPHPSSCRVRQAARALTSPLPVGSGSMNAAT